MRERVRRPARTDRDRVEGLQVTGSGDAVQSAVAGKTGWRGKWLALAAIAFFALAGAVVLYVFDPATSRLYPPCTFHMLTGLYCPGCGAGRAMHQLLHGNLLRALDLNPLLVLALPLVVYEGFAQVMLWLFNRRPRRLFGGRLSAWAVLVVILVYWVVRNIPVYPFNLLAP